MGRRLVVLTEGMIGSLAGSACTRSLGRDIVHRALLLAAFAVVLSPGGARASGSLQVTPSAAYTGSLGLEVTVGSGCLFANDLDLTGAIQGTHQACRRITAQNAQIVSPGAAFVAGHEVALGPDVEVLGEPFSATVDATLNPFGYVEDDSPDQLAAYAASFALRLDDLALGAGDDLHHLVAYSSDQKAQFRLALTQASGDNLLRLAARRDDGGYDETPAGQEISIPPGWNEIDLTWQAGSGTGSLQVSLNGSLAGTLTGLDNDTARVDFVRWGAVDGNFVATTGSLDLDAYASSP